MNKVYIVGGGCFGDLHIIAVYKDYEKALMRVQEENEKCKGINAYIEEFEVIK